MTYSIRHARWLACLALVACAGRPHGPSHLMAMHGWAGMESDPAARLLDHQALLQLSGAQVNQLIGLYEATRSQERPIRDHLHGLDHKTQRDSAGALFDQLRLLRWREESSADSLLTDDQKKTAALLEAGPRPGMMMRAVGHAGQSAR